MDTNIMAISAITVEAQANVAKAMYDLHRRTKRGLLGFSAKEIDSLLEALSAVKEEILANDDEFVRRPASWEENIETVMGESVDGLSL